MCSNLLEKLQQALPSDSSLKGIRDTAWQQFQSNGLPDRKSEGYRYIRPQRLYEGALKPCGPAQIDSRIVERWTQPECKGALLVFVNGRYSPALSDTSALPAEFEVLPLEKAISPYGAFLKRRWAEHLQQDTDPFSLLNTALHSDGFFLYLPPKTVVEQTVQILHINASVEKGGWAFPKVVLFAGTQSKINLLARPVTLSAEDSWIHQSWDFTLEEGAHVRLDTAAIGLDDTSWLMQGLRAQLKRDSHLTTSLFSTGSKATIDNYSIDLLEENCSVYLNGAALLSESRENHTNVVVNHRAPHCYSSQLFKTVLQDCARASFKGNIYVEPIAQKTDAFQLNNNLLLSEKARVDTKPGLEIFADDVKASHGATTGKIPAQPLHYLKTRGCSTQDAHKLLVTGYLQEVLDRFSLESIKAELTETIHGALSR